MRKIVLMMSVSLDGFIEGPDRELGWQLVDDELHREFNNVLAQMGAFLSGRVTHELMVGYWPYADQDPTNPAVVKEYSRIWRDTPKYVYSRTLRHADWNTTVVHDVVPDEVNALKALPGGDLALGGSDLPAVFMRLGLVDEYRIYVHPVLIGAGRPLFHDSAATVDLELIETRTFGSGVVLLRYRPTG